MFVLRAQNGPSFYLHSSKEYCVGRKDCELVIPNDQSISRLHAKLLFKDSKPFVVDCGSKYGTFVNKVKLNPKIEKEIQNGYEVHFGQLKSIYRLEKPNIITTTSTIKGESKKTLIANINFLGGSLQSNWTASCTHVTVEEILLTVKVLCAIIKGTPIVTLKYWEDYANNIKNNLPPPNIADYKPICSEVTLGKDISLSYKLERLTLFKNKMFIFPSRSDKARMIDMINLAGGEAISWDTNPLTIKDIDNSQKKYIILEMGTLVSENIEPGFSSIIKHNLEKGERTIPIQELALAVINCSCEKDCNPNFDRKGAVLALKTQKMFTQRTENILATSTQTQNPFTLKVCKNEDIIPPTHPTESNQISDVKLEEIDVIDVDLLPSPLQATTTKRENEIDNASVSSATKKIKLDDKTTGVNQIRGRSSSETSETNKSTMNHNIASKESKQEVINPFTIKRKIREGDNTESTAKRIAIAETSNLPLSSSSKIINPFSIKRSVRYDEAAGPSTSKSACLGKAIASSTLINNNVSNSMHLEISTITAVDSSIEKTCTWFSKTNCDNNESIDTKSIIKSDPHSNSAEEVDENFVKYCDSFKNSLVISVEPMVVRRSLNNTSYNTTIQNGVNHKKFKKVQPIRIQTFIIPEGSYKNFICNDHGSFEIVRDENEDDGVKIPPQRRFLF